MVSFELGKEIESLCSSVVGRWRAESELRSEVWFLLDTHNFFVVPRSWQDEKHFSLFALLSYKTNGFYIAVNLYSNRLQRTSESRRNICRWSVNKLAPYRGQLFFFLTYFDAMCDLLLNSRTATWDWDTQVNLSTTATLGQKEVAVMGRWPLGGGRGECMDSPLGPKEGAVVEGWRLL